MTPPTPGTQRPEDRPPTEPTLVDPPARHETNPLALTRSLLPIPGPVAADIPHPWSAGPGTVPGDDRSASRYHTLRPLGKGGLGEVFVALDEELNREVALKEIQEKHGTCADSVVRFLLEAEVTGRLEHPGVVPVYGLGRYADGRPYYAMRLIKGETLKDAIERFHKGDVPGRDPGERGLAFRDLLRRFIDVCNAVAYAHSKGVLHRDLKPANVMLGPFGETLVIDWGLAKVLGTTTGDSTEGVSLLQGTRAVSSGNTGLAGTPGYLSPEQAEGRNTGLTPASDVYSLGVILYEVLTGQGPFKGGPLEQVLSRQRRGVFASPRRIKASVPAALEAVCTKAMTLEPESRYGSAKELAADVDHWLGDEPVTAYREPLPARLRRWGRRHRATVTGLVALFLSLTAALAVGLALVNAEEAKTRAALKTAREQAERAEKAENGFKIELAHTSASAARNAAQRGQWKDALAHYQKAIELGHEDEVGLWLGILDCRLATYQYREFRAEVKRLEERDDLGEHRGEVRLMRAMGDVFSAGGRIDPTAAIQAALDLGLPPAEEAFARALLALDAPRAIAFLQEAIRHDPRHRRSLEVLATHLFLTGRTHEMRNAVARLELVSPDSGSAIGFRSILMAYDGDLDGALRHCARARALVGAEGEELFQAVVRLVGWLTEERLWENDPVARVQYLSDFMRLGPRLAKVVNAPDAPIGFSDLGMFRLPCYRALAEHPALKGDDAMSIAAFFASPASLADLCGATARTCPNGIFFYIQGSFLWQSGQHTQACAAMRQALTAPSFLRVDRKARFELLNMLVIRANGAPILARWPLQEEARQHLRALARDGVYPAWAYDNLRTVAYVLHENALALSLTEAWQQRFPEDGNAIRARADAEAILGAYDRQIATLTNLLTEVPSDARTVNQRAVAEYRRGYFANAAASCFEALRLDPQEPNAAGMLAKTESELRRRQAIYGVVLEKLRMRAAMILAHQGQHADAVKAVAAETAEGDTAAALACLYALASSAAAADGKLSPEERGKRAEEYATKSVDLLRRAQKAGYFKAPLRVKYLDAEHDLDTLRTRDDFRKVIDDMSK